MNLVDLTKNLVEIDSHFLNESELAKFIEIWLKDNTDCEVSIQRLENNRVNLQIKKGKKEKSILLLGHLDTVPVVEGWKTDPLKLVIKKNKLFGLGAWDMKSGLSIILNVLKNYEPENFTLKVGLVVDEENYSIGTHKLIDSGFCDDVNFAMVPEPGFEHGENGITIGRSGRATYSVKIKGKSSHGSKPDKGVNAIEQAAVFINSLKGLKLSSSKYGSSAIYPRFMTSEANGYSVPDECIIEIDSILVYPDTADSVYSKLKKVSQEIYKSKKIEYLPEINYKKRPTPFYSPYLIDEDDAFVKLTKESVRKVTGKATLFYRNSVADECIIAERVKIPVVTIGPSGENAHAASEYVDANSMNKVYESYMEALRRLDEKYS